MPKTSDEIIDAASKRFYSDRNSFGMLTRGDLQEFIETIPDGDDKVLAITAFLDRCPFLTPEDKKKTLADLSSYGI